jgi:hypothetical protein
MAGSKQGEHVEVSGDIQAFLQELDRLPWFENIGEPVGSDQVVQVSSWEEAWQRLQELAWTHLPFHKQVDQGHPVWSLAYDRALKAVAASGRDHQLEEGVSVGMQAAWDAAGAAYEIAAGRPDGFYNQLLNWYRKGHWPCGWEQGSYPEGKLVVY